jgi:hypothetical protein
LGAIGLPVVEAAAGTAAITGGAAAIGELLSYVESRAERKQLLKVLDAQSERHLGGRADSIDAPSVGSWMRSQQETNATN